MSRGSGGVVRHLHVVGRSRDGQHLLLAADPEGRGTYAVLLDARLERVVRGLDPDEDALSETVSPKEIQARLRAGASPEEVARDTGVPLVRVQRYAGPVLSEREQVLDRVRAAVLTRPRRGRSARPLGESVAANLAGTAHVRQETQAWSAYRRQDGQWVARLDVVVRGRARRAEWSFDAVAREVVALDPQAAGLGFVESRSAAAAPTARPARPLAGRGTRKRAAKATPAPTVAAAKRARAGRARGVGADPGS
ncbi:MAG: septation protein SepH [Mycobacteriales bacterium]